MLIIIGSKQEILFGMDIRIYFLALLILSFSCERRSNQQSKSFDASLLKGSWAGCSSEGLYFEVHFDGEFYAYQLENESNVLDYNVGKYKPCENLLLLSVQEEELGCNQKGVNKSKIISISNEAFVSMEDEVEIIHKRLSKKVLMGYQEGTRRLEESNYLDQFNIRKDTFNCVTIGHELTPLSQ